MSTSQLVTNATGGMWRNGTFLPRCCLWPSLWPKIANVIKMLQSNRKPP